MHPGGARPQGVNGSPQLRRDEQDKERAASRRERTLTYVTKGNVSATKLCEVYTQFAQ